MLEHVTKKDNFSTMHFSLHQANIHAIESITDFFTASYNGNKRLVIKKNASNPKRSGSGSATIIPLFPASSSEPNDIDDVELLARLNRGESEAFALLVRRHSSKFFRLAYRFTGNCTEAEDIVQDAFLKLWDQSAVWQADKNTVFTTWFYRIVVNLCLDRTKKKRPLPLEDTSYIEDERESQAETMLANEKQRLLDAQIALLPERQRTALNLCFYEGLSNQEAADIMGLHLKALQALLMRAKITLKERLRFMIGEGI